MLMPSTRRAAHTTAAPASANVVAMPSPMPRPAPVTTTTSSERLNRSDITIFLLDNILLVVNTMPSTLEQSQTSDRPARPGTMIR